MICRHPGLRVPIIGRCATSSILTARRPASGEPAGATSTIRVIEEAADLQQPCLVRADVDEGDVDVAGLDGVDQAGGLPRFMQHDLDAGPLRAEGPEEAGQDLGANAWQCPYPQLALFACGERPQVGGGGADAGDDRPSVCQQHLSGRRELHRPPAAWALEERRAHDAFQHADLLAHRRLGVAQLLGGRTEGAGLDDRHQGQEVPHLQARPGGASSVHDGY